MFTNKFSNKALNSEKGTKHSAYDFAFGELMSEKYMRAKIKRISS